MARRPLTVEDLWALPRVGAPVPSPDGKRIVVPVTTYSMEKNEGTTRLWLVPFVAMGARTTRRSPDVRPITHPDASSSQPAWSPDGKALLFVRKPGGSKNGAKPGDPRHPDKQQVYLMSLDGGEPERLTELPLGAIDPQWLPDGKRIAFVVPLYRDAPTPEETARLAKDREENPVKAAVTEDRWYRYWDQWLTDGVVHHIFVLDLETREMCDLTPGSTRMFLPDETTGQYAIAPDGGEIVFAASRSEPPHDPILWGIYTAPVPKTIRKESRAGKTTCITPDYPADTHKPIYSPDGKWIVFGMQRELDFYADRVRIVAVDRKTGRHAVLTEDWDASASHWTFARDSSTLAILAETEARTAIHTLDFRRAVRSPGKALPREWIRGGVIGTLRIAGGVLFAARSSLREPPEAYALPLGGKAFHRMTDFATPLLRDVELSEVEEETFVGAEGDRVQMFLLYPPGERPAGTGKRSSRRYPLVHMVHGGPHGAFSDEWHWRWNAQLFASPGHLVAIVNFHGSTGFGEKFTASILGRWGDQPTTDIMAATDRLIERGLVDPDRMAVTGGSYGGYLVSWIASQTDRFSAIVNHAGVCDFQTQYASDITQGRARSMGGEPWANLEGMDRYNPMRHAAGFRSPMLVIHGEKDYRVPYAQGLEIYNVYKAMGLPARLVCYPDENHWILKPRNSVHWYGEVHAWLARWLSRSRKGRKTKD